MKKDNSSEEALVKIKERVFDEIFMERMKLAIEEGRCLMTDYCTHFFAIGHDQLTREETEYIFSCWRLSDCLCVLKKKGYCDECSRKKIGRSLCPFYGEKYHTF